jgi:hypothetical protein
MTETISFVLRRHEFSLTTQQVLDIAREALAYGVPAEAQHFQDWAVDIDGHLVGARWLLVRAINFSDGVTTMDARRILGDKLGFKIVNVTDPATSNTTSTTLQLIDADRQRWVDIAVSTVFEIRGYLLGRTDNRPSDDKLCEWIHFCYTFELNAEARDLFRLIDPSQVNAWYFERTKKLAKICAMRAP